MGDLVCTQCGASTTFADAYIADLERTCETSDGEHEWVAPMNNGIDIVMG